MPRELPEELIDYTVDFLHDDSDALANCSLAGRAWLPRSTLHLFGKLCTRLVGPLGTSLGMLDFYCLPEHPRVASHVRELHVTRHGTMFIEIARMREVLSSLPCLRDLFLEDVGFILKDPCVAKVSSPRPTLASLYVFDPTFIAPIDCLLASFEAIDHVLVMRYRVLTWSSQPAAPDIDAAQPKTRVHALTVQACNSEGTRLLLAALERCAAPAALGAVALKGYSPSAALVPSVDSFLAAFPRVRRLQLLLAQHGAIDANVDDAAAGLAFAALARCAALDALHLSMPMIYHRVKAAHNRTLWAACMALLRAAPRSLRALRVDVECGLQHVKTSRSRAAEYFAMLDWSLFDAVLGELEQLEGVELWLGERPWDVAARSEVEKALSSRARRLLAAGTASEQVG